jgi:hypothetical protein
MGQLFFILRACLLATVTAGLVLWPVAAHAASVPDRSVELPSFSAKSPSVPVLPKWQSLTPAFPIGPIQIQQNPAPGILAPIGAIGAGTVVPTVLFVSEINQGYEKRRRALQQHPAEFEAKFYGLALVYSTMSVALAPAGASLFYMVGGGRVIRALGGLLFGVLFAIIAVPIGLLIAMALSSSYQNNDSARPGPVYTTFALSMYGTITLGSLAGFFLIGKRKKAPKSKTSIGVAPAWDGHQNRWIPTLSGRF